MGDFDLLNRKILYELDKDARVPYSLIGRKVRAPQEKVRYRVHGLVEQGVISKFLTVVDASHFGRALYKILLKLHSAHEKTFSEVVDFLTDSKEVLWVVRYDGIYDIGAALHVRSLDALSDFLDQLTLRFNRFIAKRVFSVNVAAEFLSREYLLEKKIRKEKAKHYRSSGDVLELDAINRRILELLGEDARVSAASIAARLEESAEVRLPISREAILKRIKKLESDKVITGYTLVLNLAAMHHLHYKVMLYLNHISIDERNALVQYCKKHPRVSFFVKSLGEWDYELDLNVKDSAHYREFMMELTMGHPGAIRDYIGLIMTDIHKYNLFPS